MPIVGFLINQSHGGEQRHSAEKIKTHTCELMLTVSAGGVFDVDEIFLWLRNKNAWIKANKNNGAGNDTFIIHDGAFAIHLFFHLLIYYFLFIIGSCAVSRRVVASQFKLCILNVINWVLDQHFKKPLV